MNVDPRQWDRNSPARETRQFALRTLFGAVTLTAVVLVPARAFLSDPSFWRLVLVYAVLFVAYSLIRGPFLIRNWRRVAHQRQQIDDERRRAIRETLQRHAEEKRRRPSDISTNR